MGLVSAAHRSTVAVRFCPGRWWLSQHLLRRFLSSGGGGFFSTVIAGFCFREAVAPSAPLAPTGFSSYPTSIYESEPLLLLCLSFWIWCCMHECRRWWIDCRRLLPSDKFVDPASYDSRYALVVYELLWKVGFEWFRPRSDDDIAVSRRIVDFSAGGRRKKEARLALRADRAAPHLLGFPEVGPYSP